MRAVSLAIVVAAAAALATAPGAAPRLSASGTCSTGRDWPVPQADLARRVVVLVNAHRKRLRLPALAVSASLARSAQWKARHMARFRYMRHNDPAPPLRRTVAARLESCGYPTSRAAWGENIAFVYETPEAVVLAWLSLRVHRLNIQQRLWVVIGVGAVYGSICLFLCAQIFGPSVWP